MNQKLQHQAMELTKHIMQEFYHNNAVPLFDVMHENMYAIGSANKFVGFGRDYLTWGLQNFYLGKVPDTQIRDVELKNCT